MGFQPFGFGFCLAYLGLAFRAKAEKCRRLSASQEYSPGV